MNEISTERLRAAYQTAKAALLAERTPDGHWIGELSSSALSTATAVAALALVDREKHADLIEAGLRWLEDHQNADGGWGDTTRSFSNISTAMLCRAAFHITKSTARYADSLARLDTYLAEHHGRTPQELAEAVRNRYGKDRTFAVPILTMSSLAGLTEWREVPSLPFELACLPQSWYRFARLPVVSYALPALIAIGQCVHYHRPTWNPVLRPLRWASKARSLKVLRRIQPGSGGYLEAAPLTSFVTMSLASIGHADHPVAREGVRFLVEGVCEDGSWPIDTNLSIWVTTLSINALAMADDLDSLSARDRLRDWLLAQQYTERHPYTGAEPGAWGWSHLSGSVPDCDDTPGALLALRNLDERNTTAMTAGCQWLWGLQNSDGGWPTFCRGWGVLPFDRSGTDLTAHALRALKDQLASHPRETQRAWDYLAREQRLDGSWLPLWFGNQHAPDDINPTYGTARVLAAYRDLDRTESEAARRGVSFLLDIQNPDGGWGGAKGTASSVEETALAVEVLLGFVPPDAQACVDRGVRWLIDAVEQGRLHEPTPIGFYFAKLWYFEKLYPIIFTVSALGRALSILPS